MQESTVLGSTHIRRHHFPETSQELGREGGVVKPAHFRDFYAQERVVGERKWEHARERECVVGPEEEAKWIVRGKLCRLCDFVKHLFRLKFLKF